MREILSITKALADENRIRALMMLTDGELCVCQIIEMLGLAPSTVSKHMYILKQAELVETSKKGRWIYYRLADNGSPVVTEILKWLEKYSKKETVILEDVKQLRRIQKISKEQLCECYKK